MARRQVGWENQDAFGKVVAEGGEAGDDTVRGLRGCPVDENVQKEGQHYLVMGARKVEWVKDGA